IRGQVRINSSIGGRNLAVIQATGDQPALLPSHTARTVKYHWDAPGLFFLGRAHLEIAYPTGTPRMATIERNGPLMLIVSPLLVVIPLAVGIAVVAWQVRRRHQARQEGRVAPRVRRSPVPVPTPARSAA